MEIKHPREGDVLPIPLEFQTFDPAWVWVYGNAVLIAGGAHDVVMLLRLVRWGEMPTLWAHRLLQHVLKECRERGFRRYMVWLASEIDEEKKLLEIAHRQGAYFEPFKGDLAVGVI
jgi:hypothetical protein